VRNKKKNSQSCFNPVIYTGNKKRNQAIVKDENFVIVVGCVIVFFPTVIMFNVV